MKKLKAIVGRIKQKLKQWHDDLIQGGPNYGGYA